MQAPGHRLGGIFDIADVGLLVLIQRSRDAYQHSVHIADKAKIRGCRELALLHDLLQRIAHNIADVILSRVYRVNLFPLDIEANGAVTGLRHFHCQGEPHIAQTDDAHHRFATADLI